MPNDTSNIPSLSDAGLLHEMGSPPDGETSVLAVVAESAEITKVEEHIGTVRVTKRTASQQVFLPLMETQDVVITKRVPIGRAVESAESSHYRDNVWVVPVYEERLIKQLFLVEELHVSKRSQRLARSEEVTLRREVLVTERFDSVTQQWVVDPS